MPIIRLAKSIVDHMRRRAALGFFLLASFILRRATDLFQRRMITNLDLRIVLSIAKLLDRFAELLLLGLTWHLNSLNREGANRP